MSLSGLCLENIKDTGDIKGMLSFSIGGERTEAVVYVYWM